MNYLVKLHMQRQKVGLIRVIREITSWGLKDTKDYVERTFTFDAWMDTDVNFEVLINAKQYGRLSHFLNRGTSDACVVSSTEVAPTDKDIQDFT